MSFTIMLWPSFSFNATRGNQSISTQNPCWNYYFQAWFHRVVVLSNKMDVYKYKRETWKDKMIKIMLKGRKLSNTYLATIRRHRWSAQMTKKKINKLELSASIVAFISWRATVLAESFNLFFFHCHLCTPAMSTNSSQVGVAQFPSF